MVWRVPLTDNRITNRLIVYQISKIFLPWKKQPLQKFHVLYPAESHLFHIKIWKINSVLQTSSLHRKSLTNGTRGIKEKTSIYVKPSVKPFLSSPASFSSFEWSNVFKQRMDLLRVCGPTFFTHAVLSVSPLTCTNSWAVSYPLSEVTSLYS